MPDSPVGLTSKWSTMPRVTRQQSPSYETCTTPASKKATTLLTISINSSSIGNASTSWPMVTSRSWTTNSKSWSHLHSHPPGIPLLKPTSTAAGPITNSSSSPHRRPKNPTNGYKRCVPKWDTKREGVYAATQRIWRWHRQSLQIGQDPLWSQTIRPQME